MGRGSGRRVAILERPGMTCRRGGEDVAATRWTLVLRARGETPEARAALGELCEAYWGPVHRFLLRDGRGPDTARELTQEFFARLLAHGNLDGADPARGRFRSFLLGAVKHFLADTRDRERRLKRGGGQVPESWEDSGGDSGESERGWADPATPPLDAVFDRDWALSVMERGLTALEEELRGEGRGAQFEVLKPWLAGEMPGMSQAEAGARLGLSEGAVKVVIHRLRRRFRDLVRADIGQTVEGEEAVQEELRYLVEVLARG